MEALELIPGVLAVPVILAIIELFKQTGYNVKHAPILAIVLGQVFALGSLYYGGTPLYTAIIMGLLAGLGAIGLYSGAKNEIEAFKKETESI